MSPYKTHVPLSISSDVCRLYVVLPRMFVKFNLASLKRTETVGAHTEADTFKLDALQGSPLPTACRYSRHPVRPTTRTKSPETDAEALYE